MEAIWVKTRDFGLSGERNAGDCFRVQPAVNSWAILRSPRWEDQAPSNSVPTPPPLPAASPGLQEVLSSSQPCTYSVTPGNLL